ncbi:unnamed protein product [Cylicocyclus nassatus]|uniref:Uncharacterized protein n=1 Tax=Cylicocyclus nassatus TaxID=53992 RepID=A0AA36H3S9_CYLNA|nr:unnamed protein product [Cylicocyclus nassatus]CAJ0603626.1 unnamed protein product [Cylicocyclus nassatus]
MRILCLLILSAVCIGSAIAQLGLGMGGMGMAPYNEPVGPFGGTPYARLKAMHGYGMMGHRGGFGGFAANNNNTFIV